MICITYNVRGGRAVPCTPEELKRARGMECVTGSSQRLKEITEQMAWIDKDSALYTSLQKEKSELKLCRPAIMPHAAEFKDGRRSNANAVPSGLVLFDVDHFNGDIRQFFKDVIEPKINVLGIAEVELSASGDGLHIIFEKPAGMTIQEAQRWMAEALDVEFDAGTFDLARTCFVVPEDYVLYQNDELLFMDRKITEEELPLYSEKEEKSCNKTRSERNENITDSTFDEEIRYGELRYRDICQEFFKLILDGRSEPLVGERHNSMLRWAVAAAKICDYDEEMLLKVVPRLGKPEQEVREIVRDALNYVRKNNSPYIQKMLKRAIENARIARYQEQKEEDEVFTEMERAPIPGNLPPVVKQLVDICPEEYKPLMIISTTTMMAEYLCRYRADYDTYEEEYPGFFHVIEGDAGSGKSFIKIPRKLILQRAIEHDNAQLDMVLRYKEEKARHAMDKDWIAPPEPKPMFMLGPTKTSPAELLKEASNNNGLALISIFTEMDSHTNSNKGSRDKSDMERIGFDGDEYSQRYASEGTVYCNARLYLNFIMTGTPNAVDRAFSDTENGLVTRVIFDELDTSYKAKAKFKKMQAKDMNLVRRYVEKAYNELFDDDGNLQPEKKMNMSFAQEAIGEMQQHYLDLACATKDLALDRFRRRAPQIGFRAMMVAWWLWGKKKIHQEDVIAFGKWFADYALDSQLRRMGTAYEEQRKVKPAEQKSFRECKYLALYNALPEVFGYEEINNMKASVSLSGETRLIIHRMKAYGLSKICKNQYKKTSWQRKQEE